MEPVPVLLYHCVSDDPPEWIAPFNVAPATFAEQLDAVLASGRAPISVARLAEAQRGGRPLDGPSVAITFDDGFADFAETALPLLAERGLPATMYITTGAMGTHHDGPLPPARMLTWDQVRESAAAGVEMGAHSCTHPELDAVPRARAEREIRDSKHRLEDELGAAVDTFAYPHGYSDATVREFVREAGFTSACAVANALSSERDDPYAVARLMLRQDTPAADFAAWLRGEGARVGPVGERLVTRGWRTYRKARRVARGGGRAYQG
jgi:peptidoglycan/xylan/chitin deacetylase (PgdA/CDA1 family)